MKQIIIISGKGGTGKTVITAAFAALAKNACFADCDVDAADLNLLLKPEIKQRHEFRSGQTAIIDQTQCNQCNICREVCRFDAIRENFVVDPITCEGCAFCSHVCPKKAITMQENIAGEWFVSETRFGPMVHAKLGIAQENSGKLVALVRKKAKEIAQLRNCDWVIVDGAPGIGCPVIASLSEIDYALIVTEPTLSGLHDADRVIGVTKHFRVPTKLIVNKYDLNIDMTKKIEEYCETNQIDLIGKISFDDSVVKSMVDGITVIEYTNGKVKQEIINIWEKIKQLK
ncbi:MAG: ATP-binding protein [Candidatus Latescibacteria bacterium]|nr:ATP-binding protein [Candidatus Latescibacterota bacterium]